MSPIRFCLGALAAAVALLPSSSMSSVAAPQGHGGARHAGALATVAKVPVPDVPPSASLKAAADILRNAGLKVGQVHCGNGPTRFSPASGTSVSFGAAVDIYVNGSCGQVLPGAIFH